MKQRYSIINILGFLLLIALVASIMAKPAWAQTGYRLPWQYCHWQKVLQGWGESPSHNNTQMWYAYDFSHSEGTPVRAARAGTVRFVQRGRTQCGGYEYRNDANYVTIEHSDGTATLYLHLRDVYVSVGQWVSQGQTIGTAGRTGWTYCTPHLHFQRQGLGAWMTNSKPVYFDEYPGQQLVRNQWYESRNYWPGDRCPTRAGIGCSGFVGAGTGTALGQRLLRRRKSARNLVGVLMAGAVVAGLLSGCGRMQAGEPATEVAAPGTPAVPIGPDVSVAAATPSPSPTVAEPPLPAPAPMPTPRPVILPSEKEVLQLKAGWKSFEDPNLGIRFLYPSEYEVRVDSFTPRKTGIQIDRPIKDPTWGEMREPFIGMFVFRIEQKDSGFTTPEEVEAWVQGLPADENPIPGGGPIQVIGKIQIGGHPAFVTMEPLWPGDPPNVQGLIVVGKERVLWISLGEVQIHPERAEKLWPQQMAFLATLQVTR